MSTSPHQQIILADASLYGTDDDPVDTVLARSVTANNLLHAADSYAQVRVNITAPLGEEITIDGTPTVGAWYPIAPFGQWPMTIRGNGTPYRLRVFVNGARSAGTGTVTFRVVIAPDYTSALAGRYESSDRVLEATSSSATRTRLTGLSTASSFANYLDVSGSDASAWTRERPAYDAVSSASPTTVQQALVSAWVFAKTTSAASIPHLTGLYVAEYMQP